MSADAVKNAAERSVGPASSSGLSGAARDAHQVDGKDTDTLRANADMTATDLSGTELAGTDTSDAQNTELARKAGAGTQGAEFTKPQTAEAAVNEDITSKTGWVVIAGLGPGNEELVTPEVRAALAEATDIVGYIPYVARIEARDGLTLHPSDNRVEIDRSQHALDMAAQGKRVVVVSSGDPGVFAMAAAVFEALEAGPEAWRAIEIRVLPGITAMLAAAAAAGAPLGHDFCAINLSDNLKPWALIEKRLRLAAEADFAMAFYNPRSKSRPEGFERTLDILRDASAEDRLILFARNVSRPDQTLRIVPLSQATPDMADMRTMVIVGSSATRVIETPNGPILYTPRSA